MESLREHLVVEARRVESLYNFNSLYRKSIPHLLSGLLQSFDENGCLPYFVGKKERYRSSPLSSTLYCLFDAGLLDRYSINIMQSALFYLKDNIVKQDLCNGKTSIELTEDDKSAWCVGEGASIWTTSKALIAQFYTRKDNHKYVDQLDNPGDDVNILVLQNAVLWLLDQQDSVTSGWKFQNEYNRKVNIHLTSLALQAIKLALNEPKIRANHIIENKIHKSIEKSQLFLVNNAIYENNQTFWRLYIDDDSIANTKPNISATAYAFDALRMTPAHESFVVSNRNKVISFFDNSIPDDPSKWINEIVVQEISKYNNDVKVFYEFLPNLLPIMLEIGYDPTNIKCKNIIDYLIVTHNDGWKMREYGDDASTFVTAQAIRCIIKWHSSLMQSVVLINNKRSSENGQSNSNANQFIKPKRNIYICSNSFLHLLISIAAFDLLIVLMKPSSQLYQRIGKISTFVLSLISSAAISTIASLIVKVIDKRVKAKNE